MDLELKPLIGKLNHTLSQCLESAGGLCMSRTNYNLEIEHWLAKILEVQDSDIARLLRHFDLEHSHIEAEVTRAIDRLKTGNSRPPTLSPKLIDLLSESWLFASISYEAPQVRSGHLLCVLLGSRDLNFVVRESIPSLSKIKIEELRADLLDVTQGSVEDVAAQEVVAGQPGAAAPRGPTDTPSLDQFTIDLTQQAREKKVDAVIGRAAEIRQIIDILTRRRQNNPILTGEAGVGKTAVVEGFALRLAKGDVPPALLNVSLRTLDLGLLQAGAGMRGEFENRLKSVINEVKSSPTPIILFVDEAHTLIGAGGGGGQGDAANLLKPALARGELRTIAATTWSEYKKYFEKDAALARRFQVVKVDEPEESPAIEMMRGIAGMLENHHNVRILDEALIDAVKLSSRYISARQLPDKSVSLLDTTCARIGLSQNATPPAIEDCQRRLEQIKVNMDILHREAAVGLNHEEKLSQLQAELESHEAELAELTERWEQEKELVSTIGDLRSQLESGVPTLGEEEAAADGQDGEQATDEKGSPPPSSTTDTDKAVTGDEAAAGQLSEEERERLREELHESRVRLSTLQGENPLVHGEVNSQAVAETVGSWTGIPVGRMLADEISTTLRLQELMEDSIIGQSHALGQIARAIQTSRANLADARKPVGVFMLAGTSGVGKTETAITLAELLYGGEQNMIVLNMTEYKDEKMGASKLLGASAGYVGYGQGGAFEAVRRKPYAVLLLDEMEKAHEQVQEIFYNIFDKGTIQDAEGRDIDFKNMIILMTTNAGSHEIMALCQDAETMPDPDPFRKAVHDVLLNTRQFQPAFLGRLDIIPYYPLSDEVIRKIVELKLSKVGSRVREHHKAKFGYATDVVESIAARCTEVETGARNIDHILTRTLLPELSTHFLGKIAEGEPIAEVHISVDGDGQFEYQIA